MADIVTSSSDSRSESQISGAGIDEESADQAEAARSDEAILEVARERLRLASEAEQAIRSAALEDLEFISGKQWPDNIQQDRDRDGRPCLVINRLPQLTQQVVNDQRQNRPSLKIHPVGDGADEDTAKIIQGLIRHIEYDSNAEVAYDTAHEAAVEGGFGYLRVVTDFTDPMSFEQDILIKRVRNQFSVFLDPFSQEPDGSDASWGFIVDELSKDDYAREYPQSKLAQPDADWNSVGNQAPTWVDSKQARVAEYFYKDYESATLHQLSTGETVLDEDLEERLAAAAQAGLPVHVVQSRETKIPVIKWCKLNGIEILDQGIWPGSFIPVVPVYGKERFINGKRILEGIARHAKDPQRMYNYWASAETEAIALAPRAPFIGAEGQFEGHEGEWQSANRRNHAYLEYKPTSIAGQQAPPPQRQAFEPAVQAITQARMMSADDLKSTTGVYDAGQGAEGNETSGLAIQRRNTQIQTANFHFTDNMTRSLKHLGRILIDLIPHIYDTARASRIISDDGSQKIVMLNQEHTDESGEKRNYDLSVGKYDVTVDVGPSFASKRQEAAASMMDFSRAVPQVAQSCADLIVKNMDWPGAQDIADRLRKLLPPQLQDNPKVKNIPPAVQAQMSQMQQLIQNLTQHLNEATKVIETKKLDLEHKERIELWNIQLQEKRLQADIEKTLAQLGSQSSVELLKQEIGALKHESALLDGRMKLLGASQPIGAPQDFNPEGADGGNYAGIGHIGGTENLTGGASPGQPMEGSTP